MKRVLKWNIPVDDRRHTIGGGQVLHAACQNHYDVIQVWTEETGEKPDRIEAQIFGTGYTYPDDGVAVATVPVKFGTHDLVWHVIVFPDTKRSDW